MGEAGKGRLHQEPVRTPSTAGAGRGLHHQLPYSRSAEPSRSQARATQKTSLSRKRIISGLANNGGDPAPSAFPAKPMTSVAAQASKVIYTLNWFDEQRKKP
jgi:hypothetical protein